MAGIGNIDWNSIKETVEIRNAKRTGMVGVIASAAKEIMADGMEYTVAQIRGWIEAGLNQNKAEDEEPVEVNWITVKYALTHTDGFKEVSKNTFVYAPKKKKN